MPIRDYKVNVVLNEVTIFKLCVNYLINHYELLSSKRYSKNNIAEKFDDQITKDAILQILKYFKLDWEIIHDLHIRFEGKIVKELKKKYRQKRK